MIVHGIPNVMADGPTNISTFELDGDVMWRTFTNEDNGNQFRVKFERRE